MERIDRIEAAIEGNTKNIDENAKNIADLERTVRTWFAEYHKLDAERDQSRLRLENALAHLVEVIADHEQRLKPKGEA